MSTTPAASADDIAKYGWTAVPRDVDAILNGRPYIHEPSPLRVDDIPFPSDDPVVAKVQEYAKTHLPAPTYNHSMRVYYWGYAIMTAQFPTHASPLSLPTWALTCLLHDIGTTPTNLRNTLLSFEFAGGVRALHLLTHDCGAPAPQAEGVAEAIIRHQDLPPPPPKHSSTRAISRGEVATGTISFLGLVVQLATIFDNVGERAALVHEVTRADVCMRFERMGWSACFAGVVEEEVGLKPWAHSSVLGVGVGDGGDGEGKGGFVERVRGNEVMREYDGWGL
ncbi:hypothetical protein F5B20DRAFT_589109 [Whalleya microplaca]|nr:hypothetical protein F5B20DRAFT_589109 [Whalleya microplaca]